MDSVLMNSRFLNAGFCEQMLKQGRQGKPGLASSKRVFVGAVFGFELLTRWLSPF
jgi:hypothetical protein